MDDLNWHHYCLTFSGESGLITQYADGKKAVSETGVAVEFDGGGTLQFGQKRGQGYQLSGFNLWDRVLPPEEIDDLASSCLKGIGNVKHWFQFSDAAQSSSSVKVIAPSVCHAPAPQRDTEPEEPAE